MYAKRIDCPECGEKVLSNERKCDCGWRISNNNNDQNDRFRHRCIFMLGGKRCPLTGVSGSRVGEMRCQYHEDNKNSPSWFEYIEKNQQEIFHYRDHYRTNFKGCERCDKFCDNEDIFCGKRPRSSFRAETEKRQKSSNIPELSAETKKLGAELDARQMQKILAELDFKETENKDAEDILW